MVMSSTLLGLVYPPPPSLFVTAMSVISAASLANAGFNEIKGKHMQYSKFWHVVASQSLPTGTAHHHQQQQQIKLSGRRGMLILYTPAFLVGAASFYFFPDEGIRFTLLTSALTIHFFKRVFEVLFVHKYSGSMALDTAITIGLSYFLSTATMIYAQYLSRGFSDLPIDLKYAGTVMFLLGITCNFYHHYLLSKLRKEGDREYKLPSGGLFNLVICPHYFFEILGFVGVSCISQTLYAFSFTLGTILYLMGRSYATRKCGGVVGGIGVLVGISLWCVGNEVETMMIPSVLQGFLFQEPPSIIITAMSVVTIMFSSYLGISEITGNHLQYSKFWNVGSQKISAKLQNKLSSRTGMLILYTPAFLAGLASFAIYPDGGFRFFMVKLTLTVHFLKRVLEVLFVHKYSGVMVLDTAILVSGCYLMAAVLFVHKYSGSMALDTAITIGLSYFLSTATMIYAQYLSRGFSDLPIDLKYAGTVMFLLGITGNFYHHYLLSKLRKEGGDREYKLPSGGLFNLVICPHYFFEILGFVGVSCISQTLYAFSFTLGTILYLMGRSYATRKWYLSKFEDFPMDVKALFPFIF
ncbi:hypothetical protein RJ640_001345 [Escallonia rubra]|uniref:3-oxo-5-alpha-steroid 4-dehydrogenase C-terminal domain-containing protein n=1 Tax=Escallonia rubra TaxID=112253 RepID=A0AA88QTH9_9ASTE|nr:hypothetical protein RJ640_001345 [Escallonia rubra]